MFRLLVAVTLGLSSGCDERPWVSGKSDPKQEANFRQAEAYQRLGQYPKAIEYFQRALDVNPRNAEAHLGLGLIFSDATKQPEYGYAYYHLNRYVEMAHATNDAIVVPLIQASGLKLAERYATAIGKIQTQGELEQQKKDNLDLRRAVTSLTEQLQMANARLGLTPATDRSGAIKSGLIPAPIPAPIQAPLNPGLSPVRTPPTTNSPAQPIRRSTVSTNRLQSPGTPTPATPTARTAPKAYKVQSRDTLASIAKQNGITVAQLQGANPGVDSRRLKVGQELRIP